jgi:enoyl-CoA hydratase/carnithine racemase
MGTPVSSERARELGLVNRVVPRERLLEEALSLAEATGAGSPDSLAYTKELLWHASGLSTSAALDLAVRVNLLARTGPDMHEGLAAFFEKRRPNWKPS